MALVLTISPGDRIELDDGDTATITARKAGPYSERVEIQFDAPEAVQIRRIREDDDEDETPGDKSE